MTEQWVAKKLEVLVDVPEQVDLEWLRGCGPQPHDQLQPEEPAASSQAGALGTLAAAAGAPLPVDPCHPCLFLFCIFLDSIVHAPYTCLKAVLLLFVPHYV